MDHSPEVKAKTIIFLEEMKENLGSRQRFLRTHTQNTNKRKK